MSFDIDGEQSDEEKLILLQILLILLDWLLKTGGAS